MLDELQNQQDAPVENTQDATVEERKSDKEQNMRMLRERAEAAEKRLQELEAERQRQEEPKRDTSSYPQDDYGIDDDMYLEGRHFKKAFQPITEKLNKAEQAYMQTQKELEKMRQERMLADAEQRVQQKYPDFSSVVTQENLKKLELTKPHLYHAVRDTQDVYSKAAAAYELIKNSAILDPNPEAEERIQNNQQRPKSAAGMGGQSASTSPLSRVGDYDRRVMTPERRAELQRMMQQYKQG